LPTNQLLCHQNHCCINPILCWSNVTRPNDRLATVVSTQHFFGEMSVGQIVFGQKSQHVNLASHIASSSAVAIFT
jgi:hypothetical protein